MDPSIIPQFMERQLKFVSIQTWSLIPLILLMSLILQQWRRKDTISRHKLPPSPPKLPIIGNIHQLNPLPHYSLRLLSGKYGELMLIHLGSVPTLIVSSARAAREILITHDATFSDRPITKRSRILLYNCKEVAAAPYGEHWRHMKSICVLHLLNKKKVCSFHRDREEEITLLIDKIRQSIDYSPVNLSVLFKQFTNNVICRVVFGRKFSEIEEGINFNKLMKELTGVISGFCFGDFIPWLAWLDRFNGWDARVNKIAKKFDQILEKVIKEHQDFVAENGENNNLNVQDFANVLLRFQMEHTDRLPIDRDSIKALMMDMLGAGTNSTYSLLEWAMAEILKHPKILKELQNEVREITGQKLHVEKDDLEQMKYLKAVIKETLRLHIPVPLLMPRLATQDTKICGYDIPKGTTVIINGWAIHRDPVSWDEPEKFNPERFMNSPRDFRGHDLEFIPFGAGRRMCPGISFAMASSELLLANLIHKFDWNLPVGVERETLDMSECFMVSLHKKTPLLAVTIAPTVAGSS